MKIMNKTEQGTWSHWEKNPENLQLQTSEAVKKMLQIYAVGETPKTLVTNCTQLLLTKCWTYAHYE